MSWKGCQVRESKIDLFWICRQITR